MGRKSKLTPEMIVEISGHVKNGLNNRDACRLSGISEGTLYRWLESGGNSQNGHI